MGLPVIMAPASVINSMSYSKAAQYPIEKPIIRKEKRGLEYEVTKQDIPLKPFLILFKGKLKNKQNR